MKPTWLIHNYAQDEFDQIKAALDLTETPFQEIIYKNSFDKIDIASLPKNDECVVCYGSLQFASALKSNYTPGFYGLSDKTECSQYMPNIPSEYLLNYPYIITSWAELKRSRTYYNSIFSWGGLFVKSNKGKKTFPGQVLRDTEVHWNADIKIVEDTSSVSDNTLVLVSKSATFDKGEYRFVIVNKKVITGSMYNWDKDSNSNYPKEAEELAQKIADLEWQLDTAYTCDIAMTQNGPKVIELNSFGCAGLYACDRVKIVNAINEMALSEYRDMHV